MVVTGIFLWGAAFIAISGDSADVILNALGVSFIIEIDNTIADLITDKTIAPLLGEGGVCCVLNLPSPTGVINRRRNKTLVPKKSPLFIGKI